MKPPKIHPDLREFLRCLKGHGVRFVVGGSYVMAILGRPRFTKDIDILVEPSASNAERLAAALRDFGYTELAMAAGSHFAHEERMATLGVPPVAILGLAQFVKAKRASGRPIDMTDLALLDEAGLLDELDEGAGSWPGYFTARASAHRRMATTRARR